MKYGAAPTDRVSPAPIGKVTFLVLVRVRHPKTHEPEGWVERQPIEAPSWYDARTEAMARGSGDGRPLDPEDVRIVLMQERR